MKTKIAATLLVSVLTLSLFAAAPSANAAIIGDNECKPAVLFLRGSDESNLGVKEYQKEIVDENGDVSFSGPILTKTSGNEGETLRRLVQNFINQADPAETVNHVRFIGVEYPALSVPGFPVNNGAFGEEGRDLTIWEHIMKYDESYRMGAEEVVSFIREDELRGCNTNYMLVGYSQGVISLRLAIGLLGEDADKIVSTYVIGDPFQTAFAAWSDKQKSPANTSSYTIGVGHNAANALGAVSAITFNPIFIPFILAYQASMVKADPLVYQNDSYRGRYSRALCHQGDPVCGIEPQFSMTEHMNYFNKDEDLTYEISEFNTQVEFLADSSPKTLKTRGLNSHLGMDGEVTYYVSGINATAGTKDKCYWDKDSNGIEELGLENCGPLTFMHSDTSVAKMTVRIVDYLGNEYVRSIETKMFKQQTLEELYALDETTWYQIHPHSDSDKCITFSQNPYESFQKRDEEGNLVQNHTDLTVSDCVDTLTDTSNLSEMFKLSMQLFKIENFQLYGDGETRQRWVSGYDDDLSLSGEVVGMVGPVRLTSKAGDYPASSFEPKLAKIVDGKPYYNFWHARGFQNPQVSDPNNRYCLATNVSNDYLNTSGVCLSDYYTNYTKQLFSITPVSGDYGELSLERDVTAPSEVSNLQILELTSNEAVLTWDTSVDNRWSSVHYEVYRLVNGTEELVTKTSETSIAIDLSENSPYKTEIFTVKAIDGTGNATPGNSVTFTTPSVFTPETPYLDSITSNYTSAIIVFPSSGMENTESILIYRDGVLLAASNEMVYTDQGLTRGASYEYSYKVVTSSGLTSEMSDPLIVHVADLESPSAPTNLLLNEVNSNFAHIIWTPVADTADSSLTYHLYRDGTELVNDVFVNEFGAFDYSVQPDATYSYTVIAEDAYSNRSLESEPITVTIPGYNDTGENQDTEAPSQPTLTAYETWDSGVHFTIETTDNSGDYYFEIYRNGEFLTTHYGLDFYDVDLSPETSYEYYAVAKDYSDNASLPSDSLLMTTAAVFNPGGGGNGLPPAVDTISLDYLTHNVAQITWTVENQGWNSYFYDVYRDGILIGENLMFNTYANGSNTEAYSYTDFSVQPGVSYSYQIKLRVPGEPEQELSDPFVVTTPTAPTDNTVDSILPSNVKLSYLAQMDQAVHIGWTPAVDDTAIEKYELYRNGTLVHTSFVNGDVHGNYYDDADVASLPGTIYSYQVKITDTAGNETVSEEFSITIQ